jgi:hypothetical protein
MLAWPSLMCTIRLPKYDCVREPPKHHILTLVCAYDSYVFASYFLSAPRFK